MIRQTIAILDFGSQYGQLIARRVRELNVYSKIYRADYPAEELAKLPLKGIILSGGPASVYGENAPRCDENIFDLGVPILGICYGMQTMAQQLGGQVINADEHEYGYAKVRAHGHTKFLVDIEDEVTPEGFGMLDVWMSHGDRVEAMPEGFKLMASTPSCPVAGMANEEKNFYGIQFHPEVTHTKQGLRMIERFAVDLCGCEKLWTTENIIEDSIKRVREQVGTDQVMLGLSGGVDSSVVAALLHKAIGDQLTCVFVDHGLLRYKEGDQVMAMFAENMGIKVIRADVEDRFMAALAGETDPEKKRKIIGHVFIDVFDEESKKLKNAKWLAQGTIYPDVIESAGAKTGKAHVIKSHHNVGGLPDDMEMGLVEPMRELFKDEVRILGKELGLPDHFIGRHPFPGPGLAIRCPGGISREKLEILREADAVYLDEIRKAGLYDKIWQAFAVLLPVQTVGVMGDGRTYEYVIALRAVQTQDFMTASWAELPYSLLGKVSNRIINEIRGINRVVYDVSGKPPATIEWE